MTPASLVERNPLWILPVIPLALLMVHAMMEFMSGLLADRPGRADPAGGIEVQRDLLALNRTARGYRLVADNDRSFRVEWDVVDAAWAARFSRVRLTENYRATGFMDDNRHELRYRESIRTGGFFYGWQGHRPRFGTSSSFFAGPLDVLWSGLAVGLLPGWPPRIGDVRPFQVDTRIAKHDIRTVVREAGWGVRPVFWPFETSWRVARITAAIVPHAVQRLPVVKLWGVLYPLSFAATIAYLALVISPRLFDARDVSILLLVCATWWGVWGLLARSLLSGGRRHASR